MKIYFAKCDKKYSHDFLFEVLEKHYNVYATDADLIQSHYGKLSLKNSTINFNITHSGEIVAVGVSDKQLGIDVEFIKPRNNAKLSQKIFGVIPNTDEEFYRLWTKAECFVKYSASALIPELKKIEIVGDEIFYDGNKSDVKTKTFTVKNYVFSVTSEDLDVDFIEQEDFIR